MTDVLTFGSDPDAAKRLRREWAASLDEHMDAQGLTRKDLQHQLRERGVNVTTQAIGAWLRGETSPRLHHQAAIAAVLKVPVRSLFPVSAA